ncbi:hypothetical protein T484DRAFT_1843234, partial [Baffinella frigidus]
MATEGGLVDAEGKGKLAEAALLENVEEVLKLIAAGANIEERDDYGWTGLLDASFNGHHEMARRIDGRRWMLTYGWTPLLDASFNGHDEM